MRKITKLFVTLMLLLVAGVANAAVKEFELDQKLTSIAALDGQKFAIVNETDGKAFFGTTNQNLGYDVYASAFVETNTALSWRLVAASGEGVEGMYYLQSVKADGTDYSIWGGGYLNSQPATGGCCFIMGLNGQNGQDGKNLAVWAIEVQDGKFALKNLGTGLYLKDATPAKYEDATYFNFYTLKEKVSADPLAAEKSDLSDAIAKGKIVPALAYTEASFAAVGSAVLAGEAALAAADATAESLTAAIAAINDAIAALVLKDGYTNLTADMFKAWDKCNTADVTSTGAAGCSYKLFVADGLPYGDGNVGELNFADLSGFDKLILVATEGTPRFMMNRDVANGQWSATEAESHLIEYPKDGWSSKYFTKEETVFTVDLKQIVADKGFAHLNAIKGANWANVLVTGMYLYKAPAAPAFEPAYGVIWENGETTVDGDFTVAQLNPGYFKNFAKAGDKLTIEFAVAAARAARIIKKGNISFYAGTEFLCEYKDIESDITSVEIELTEEMITKLAAAETVALRYQNMALSKVTLVEKPAPAFEPAYGKIWENGETATEGEFTVAQLDARYFKGFAKAGDKLTVDFAVVEAARAARNVKKGYIAFYAGVDQLFEAKDIAADVTSVDIELTEDMLAKLAAAETVSLSYQNMTVSTVTLVEKAAAPFEPVDCTAKVNVDGWQSEIGNVGSYTKDVAQKEQYLTNTTTLGQVLYQTVEGLDNGTYTVELYANASYTEGRGFTSAALNNELGRVIVYAGDVEKTIPVIYQTAVGENNIVKLENVVVSDGTLKMGLRKDIAGSNWHTIQIKSLIQESDKAQADAAAQDEYWKGIAATVAAYEAYANVAGVEKAAIAAAQTKAAAQAAIAPFYAAKAGYDALVAIVAKAKSLSMDVADAEALLASPEATAERAAAMAESLIHPVNLAYNTSKATEGADMTFVIENPSFETGNTQGWTYEPSNDHGAKENSNGTYTMSGCDGNYLFNIWSSGNAISQVIEDLPNGTYKMTAVVATDGGHKVQLNANDKNVQIEAVGKETGVEGEVEFNVLDNKATIGAEGVDKYWYKVDNFRLTYVKGFDLAALVKAYEDALVAAKAVEGDMNAEVKAALEAAIATEVDKTNPDALASATAALTNATAAATASVTAYAKAAQVLPKMKQLTEETNVYTAAAKEEYYDQWVAKFDAKTLTTTEANALEDPFLVTQWHAAITCDNFLLSAWDTEADKFQGYYINSWSTEGVEGSNNYAGAPFGVPFFEYWTDDNNSLGAKTLTATMNNLEAGEYKVTALVRVRAKNGYEAPAYGIALQANEGEAVNVAAGAQIGESQFYMDEFTAEGTVAEDGTLKIKFIVASDNNISWLSFKNVKFEKKQIEVAHTWNFTKWSEETVANLKAEAAKVTVEADPDNEGNTKCTDNGALWSDHEKKPGTTCETYAVSKDNCFWYIGGEAEPTANGTAIAEFAGLEFNTTYGASRALAIAVNYPSTSLGTYNGPSYLWFGGKNQEILTIKNVKAGTTIKIGIESHKSTDPRGVKLFAGETELTDPEGQAVAAPTTYVEQTWQVPAGESVVDVVVKNTNGCHIYFIDAEIGTNSIKSIAADHMNGAIYNLNGQKVTKMTKGLFIQNGKKVFVK